MWVPGSSRQEKGVGCRGGAGVGWGVCVGRWGVWVFLGGGAATTDVSRTGGGGGAAASSDSGGGRRHALCKGVHAAQRAFFRRPARCVYVYAQSRADDTMLLENALLLGNTCCKREDTWWGMPTGQCWISGCCSARRPAAAATPVGARRPTAAAIAGGRSLARPPGRPPPPPPPPAVARLPSAVLRPRRGPDPPARALSAIGCGSQSFHTHAIRCLGSLAGLSVEALITPSSHSGAEGWLPGIVSGATRHRWQINAIPA